uniref:Uncharacterized protein n=1 Tax=Lotus japonicus TaxID=34305 RepID=I3SML5_LOTJA|nr:unknown [Lotus japonicus]
MRMKSPNSPFFLPLLFFFSAISLLHQASSRVSGHQTEWNSKETQHGNGFGRRVLMSFKEKHKGSNLTFECAPSGPRVPCLYSEKGDEKYRNHIEVYLIIHRLQIISHRHMSLIEAVYLQLLKRS